MRHLNTCVQFSLNINIHNPVFFYLYKFTSGFLDDNSITFPFQFNSCHLLQKQIRDMLRKSQQKILEKEKKLQDLKQAVNILKVGTNLRSAGTFHFTLSFIVNMSQRWWEQAFLPYQSSSQAAVEESERIFTELLVFVEEKCYEVTKLIRAQEKAELDQAAGLQEQLEKEISDLKRRDSELELLSDTEDHVYFLQVQPENFLKYFLWQLNLLLISLGHGCNNKATLPNPNVQNIPSCCRSDTLTDTPISANPMIFPHLLTHSYNWGLFVEDPDCLRRLKS